MTSTGKIMVECKGEDWCPLTATANTLSKKWHPVIIHRLLDAGPLGFNNLKEEVGGVSSKVLSESLEDLEEQGIVDREIISEKPFRVRYSLTQTGKDLETVLDEMVKWGKKNLKSPEKGV